MINNLCKRHKVYFHGLRLPLEDLVKPAPADFMEIKADVTWKGIDYNKVLGSFFLNIRDLESVLIYCISECILTFSNKNPIDYHDIASTSGCAKNKKIDFSLGKLSYYLKNKNNLNRDSFNQLRNPLTFFKSIRNALFHANTVNSFYINVHNGKLYFNTSPMIDDAGVYAHVYEANKDFFEEINKYIATTKFELLKITDHIKTKTP